MTKGWMIGFSSPGRGGNSSLRYHVQTGTGVHPASNPVGNRGPFPEGKAKGREADHSLSFSADVKNACSYNSTFHYAFMV
jgi:hypothetical protein